jgi:hypothetical protein
VTDTIAYQDIESLLAWDPSIRYEYDNRGNISVFDSQYGIFLEVGIGDTIQRIEDGFAVIRQGRTSGLITTATIMPKITGHIRG